MTPIALETVDALCGFMRLKVAEPELRVLAGMLERQNEAFRAVEELDLQETIPAGRFEPDWR
jgi:hypothetical protein